MSVDAHIEVEIDGEWEYLDDTWINYTHNLSPMYREAGFPHWTDYDGAPVSEFAGVIRGALDRMEGNPERFRALNPPNGWGTYEGALDVLRQMYRSCRLHLNGVWRANG